ncbi:hypothetical protein NBRC116583_02250 [Arenicella sp. 4NH20-0111]|uniref:C25 family cysteine peptidase n=1 Tax=Arenicella sp. 4NH20-0111 TaxID=3127648 RepID=UPI0031065306
MNNHNFLKTISVSTSLILGAVSSSVIAADDVVNLVTVAEGIHELTGQDLKRFGIDLTGTDVSSIGLMNNGQPVPIQLVGGSSFSNSSKIRFIADAVNTLYTDENVYTLTLNGSAERISDEATPLMTRTSFANSYLATERFAPQAKYSFTSPKSDDPWYAKRIVAVGKQKSEQFTMMLENVAPGGNDGLSGAKMSMNVWGASDLPGPQNDHHVQVSFNGKPLTSGRFDGLRSKTLEAPLEGVVDGANRIELTLPMDTGQAYDAVNLNSIEVTYPSQFVAQDSRLNFESRQAKFRIQELAPTGTLNNRPTVDVVAMRRDSNGTVNISTVSASCRVTCKATVPGSGQLANYYVSSEAAMLKPSLSPMPLESDIHSGNARYLIISHPDFIGSAGDYQLESLATQLQSEMGSVDVVDVESIYAQFGFHQFDPEAIRNYIKYSHLNRGTEYVLLVGGDVYDYRQFENEDAMSFIPSIYAATGNNITFAPVDSKYVDLNDNNIPDLPIGRLPVRTNAQLKILLDKRDDFLNRSYTGKALLVADKYDAAQQYDFANDADEIHSEYLQGFQVEKAYVDTLGVSAARQKVRDQINSGITLTAFFGHSSTNQWSFDGLFTGPDAAGLSNQDKPTVVTQWGCWNAYYVSPNEDSMGHRFMMEGDRGAVAVMGASTLTNADSERRLARMVFARLANGERLGDAVTSAKQEYSITQPNDLDVLMGWTVLGFPELILN